MSISNGIVCRIFYEYVFALVMISILLFVYNILIRLAWQAVAVSWSLNCDANADWKLGTHKLALPH